MTKPRKSRRGTFATYVTAEAAKVACEPGQSVYVEGFCTNPRCPWRYTSRKVSDLIAEKAPCKRCIMCGRPQRGGLRFHAKKKRVGLHRPSSRVAR